jgi:hypothetical protein
MEDLAAKKQTKVLRNARRLAYGGAQRKDDPEASIDGIEGKVQ